MMRFGANFEGDAFGVKAEYDGDSTTIDGGGNLQLAYGVIRATFVLGT